MLAIGQLRRKRRHQAVTLNIDELVVLGRVQDDEALNTLRLEVESVHADADLLAEA